MAEQPQLLHTVIDAPDPRVLAEFYGSSRAAVPTG